MENRKIIGVALIITGVATFLFVVLSAYSWHFMPMHNYGPGGFKNFGNQTYEDDYRGMGMMHGNVLVSSERDFIEHMVPHHEEAIETAREVLERGGTTEGMVALANNIITSQTAEVEMMKDSYQEWYGEEYVDTGEYRPMMRELARYEGVTLDKVFLHDMTMHHMGAIMMARSLQPRIEHEAMQELTDNIIVNQTREIELMQQLFVELR